MAGYSVGRIGNISNAGGTSGSESDVLVVSNTKYWIRGHRESNNIGNILLTGNSGINSIINRQFNSNSSEVDLVNVCLDHSIRKQISNCFELHHTQIKCTYSVNIAYSSIMNIIISSVSNSLLYLCSTITNS